MSARCQIRWLGQVAYERALELQKELVSKRTANEIPDTLLLLEHPPTYTLGTEGHREHLLISREELTHLNIAYHQVDRGGSIIYHCPGQLVVYPVLKLEDNFYTYHDYIKRLESVIIRALSYFKVRAFRQQGQRGIWVFSGKFRAYPGRQVDSAVAKISAIGVKIDANNITSHGFSINVNPSLEYFDLIMPAGVKDCHITSLQQVLNRFITVGDVIEPVVQSFCQVFEREALSFKTPLIVDQNFAWRTSTPAI
jgi:lipoyl(octanoyl) transferase